MSTETIRKALRSAGLNGLLYGEIKKTTGIANPGGYISSLTRSGEVSTEDTPDGKRYRIDPDWQRRKKTARDLPLKRPKKKPGAQKTARGPRPPKTMRDIAARAGAATPLSALALRQLIAASQLLRVTIAEQVDGLDKNPLLTGAIANAERAERLAEAV